MSIPNASRTGRESEPGAGNHVPAAVLGEGCAAGIRVPEASAVEASAKADGAREPSRAGTPLPARDGTERASSDEEKPAPLKGEAWQKAVKDATSALHAEQRRGRARYPRRSAGQRYAPGMSRRRPPEPPGGDAA